MHCSRSCLRVLRLATSVTTKPMDGRNWLLFGWAAGLVYALRLWFRVGQEHTIIDKKKGSTTENLYGSRTFLCSCSLLASDTDGAGTGLFLTTRKGVDKCGRKSTCPRLRGCNRSQTSSQYGPAFESGGVRCDVQVVRDSLRNSIYGFLSHLSLCGSVGRRCECSKDYLLQTGAATFDRFPRATTEFTLCVLDRYGLRDHWPARPTLTPQTG
jgi:hypothetical protein